MKIVNRQVVIVNLPIDGTNTTYNVSITFSRVRFKATHVIVRQVTQTVAAAVVDFVSVASDFTGDNTIAVTPGYSCSVTPGTVIPVTVPVLGTKKFLIETLTNTAYNIGLLLEFIEEEKDGNR